MIRSILTAMCLFIPFAGNAEATSDAAAGEVRVLDRLTGAITDLTIRAGDTATVGHLKVTLNACRYPTSNPSGNAYTELVVVYRDQARPVFSGWMIASVPALNAMDHARYDVWALRCITS